ncbi:MAG TPA: DUF1963 domain-containing protein [Novosphingobium sp.]|nr:DUF1963 domain-containing protein [Novosphingobium sp.]
MNRTIAALAGFALPALTAAYVALAPLGGSFAPLDLAAERLIGGHDRGGTVIALLGMGIVVGLLTALLATRMPPPPRPAMDLYEEEPEPAPAPEAFPEALTDPRIAGLRRRALPDEAPMAADPGATPSPVILVRKPRRRERDWFSDRSWLGGLPRLGPAPWPRDRNGVPLPFAAQIDLAELSLAAPDAALPTTGSLAFFLGTGAVVAVPDGAHDFTDPPADLPPAYEEGGGPFPTPPTRLSRWFFPFWPVDLLALDLPVHLRDHRDPMNDLAIEEAMAAQVQRHCAPRDHPFYAAGVGAPVEALWWHSVIHLADQLHEALAACARPLAMQGAALDQKLAALAQLEHDPRALSEAVEHARQTAAYLAAELEEAEAQCAALPAMVEALDQFVAGREPWTELAPEELEVVADILSEVHERFGDLVRYHVPGSLAQLATLSLRAMVSGPPEALAALPEQVLLRINAEYRLPPVDQHQMFGLPAGLPATRDAHRGDILLLQLGYDDMMEWCWSEAGLHQFWIGTGDAAARNWTAAALTFQSD